MDEREYLNDYRYTGITGLIYIPFIQDEKWYLVPGQVVSFWALVYLCNMPDDEAMLLKLKYSVKVTV